MIINNREIIFRTSYLNDLVKLRTFLDEYDSGYADKFVNDTFGFITNAIAPHPEIHPEYRFKRTKYKFYRRAIYKKNYLIIFKLTKKKIELLTIFHANRNPKNVKF